MSIRGTAATLGILLRSAPCAYLGRAVSSPNLASIVQLALPAARIRRMSPMVVGVDAIIKGFNLPTLVTLFGVRVLQYGPSGNALPEPLKEVRRICRSAHWSEKSG